MDAKGRKLHQVAQRCMEIGRYTSAIFYADQLLTQHRGVEEVLLLGRAYALSGQHRRALHLMETENMLKATPECFLLSADCLVQCEEWEYALELLDFTCQEDLRDMAGEVSGALCFLKGQILEFLENRAGASKWYKQALFHDPLCYEAFAKLTEGHMLTGKQEKELMASLRLEEADLDCVARLYRHKVNKYDQWKHLEEDSATNKDKRERHGDGRSIALLSSHAEAHYYHNEFEECHKLTTEILERDPYNRGNALTLHISALAELGLSPDLFYCAHKLVDEDPELAVSWYAVACYYMLIGKSEEARSFFSKATTLDPHFGPAWLGFGHAFSQEGEHDQAMAAYRTASKMLLGCHIPSLCIGVELMKTSNPNLALKFMEQAKRICTLDPLVHHEIGVVAYNHKKFHEAMSHFEEALRLFKDRLSVVAEPTLVNLGHVCRKLGEYQKALEFYREALQVVPNMASTYVALAFTRYLMGHKEQAINCYHKALGLQPDDTLCKALLDTAIAEAASEPLTPL